MDALLAAPIGALLIFLLRIVDVSMSIMRMILAVRGHRSAAAVIGFFEVLIWLVAVGAALEHLDSWLHIVGYAAGFAAGNYVGVSVEARFAMGIKVVRAIFPEVKPPDGRTTGEAAAHALREAGFAVTEMSGRGREGAVEILNVVVSRKRVDEVVGIVQGFEAGAFVTVEAVRTAHGGIIRPGGRKTPFLTGGSHRRGTRSPRHTRRGGQHLGKNAWLSLDAVVLNRATVPLRGRRPTFGRVIAP